MSWIRWIILAGCLGWCGLGPPRAGARLDLALEAGRVVESDRLSQAGLPGMPDRAPGSDDIWPDFDPGSAEDELEPLWGHGQAARYELGWIETGRVWPGWSSGRSRWQVRLPRDYPSRC